MHVKETAGQACIPYLYIFMRQMYIVNSSLSRFLWNAKILVICLQAVCTYRSILLHPPLAIKSAREILL